MKTLTFAAGLAAGYVLGTRAGRERFDQLVRSARNLGNHPTVVQAQDKVKEALSSDSRPQPPTPAATPTPTATPASAAGRAKTSTTSTTSTAGAAAPKPVTR
jgi:hypothetical protein